MEVTAINANQITHNLTAYLAAGSARNPRFNPAGGLGVVYQGTGTANVSRVFNLGNLYYAPPGGTVPTNLARLQLLRPRKRQLDGDVSIPDQQRPTGRHLGRRQHLAHARLYGLDDGQQRRDRALQRHPDSGRRHRRRYVDAATFNALLALAPVPTPWARLVAVRIALVSRSALPRNPPRGSSAIRAMQPPPSLSGPVLRGRVRRSITRRDSM